MLLLGALFALFMAGFWLYCLVDVVLTPGSECRGLPKAAWITVVAGTFVIGAVMWLAFRRPARPTVAPASRRDTTRATRPPYAREGRSGAVPGSVRRGPRTGNGSDVAGGRPGGGEGLGRSGRPEAEAALLRHPAGRSRPRGTSGRSRPPGPDDDAEFLRSLSRAIHGAEIGDDPAG